MHCSHLSCSYVVLTLSLAALVFIAAVCLAGFSQQLCFCCSLLLQFFSCSVASFLCSVWATFGSAAFLFCGTVLFCIFSAAIFFLLPFAASMSENFVLVAAVHAHAATFFPQPFHACSHLIVAFFLQPFFLIRSHLVFAQCS